MREFLDRLAHDTAALESQGLLKRERLIDSAQGPVVRLADGRELINLCANNYLGLANDPGVIEAAHAALDRHGYGVASVRFICGTQLIHRELEERLSAFLGTDDAILYSSCFDANGGLFETLLGEEDAVISDALNHASIIDGIRLCRAQRLRYANNDMRELELRLQESQGARVRLIATDGVFSMDGSIARLADICELADRYRALVMVDDSHATGFIGEGGRGTHAHCGVVGRIDILTGTFGKALGGASGGYVAARREIVGWLRQRSRPTCSPTVSPRWSRPARCGCSTCWPHPATCARACTRTPGTSAPGCRNSASRCCRASTRSYRSCSAMRRSASGSPNACSPRACMSSPSAIRSYRRARQGSARR